MTAKDEAGMPMLVDAAHEHRITIEIDSLDSIGIERIFNTLRSQIGIFAEIGEERGRQVAQWGGAAVDDTRSSFDWINYIERQIRKADSVSFRHYRGEDAEFDSAAYRERLIKIAALAVAAIESIDRKATA